MGELFQCALCGLSKHERCSAEVLEGQSVHAGLDDATMALCHQSLPGPFNHERAYCACCMALLR